MATSIEFLSSLLSNISIKAALKTIRECEGTAYEDGYNYLFGSSPNNARRFLDFSTHPNQKFPFNGGVSDASGAYQILYSTFVSLCERYGFKDFTPQTQDLMALALLDTAGVLILMSEGKIFYPIVINKVNKIWASLPGAGYGQPEKKIAEVRNWYLGYGGIIAA